MTTLLGLLIGSAMVIIITVLYGIAYYYCSKVYLDVTTEHIRGHGLRNSDYTQQRWEKKYIFFPQGGHY